MANRSPNSDVIGPKVLNPQVFVMVRNADETGVSGTGPVADGIVFPSGSCVVEWRGSTPCVQVWSSFSAFKRVHIDPHPDNRTELRWLSVENSI